MVAGGIRDVLVANEVVGAGKLRRVADLAREATITVCVDDPGNLEELGRAVNRAGSTIGVMEEPLAGSTASSIKTSRDKPCL